ncbi:calcium binding EGF domain protein [Cooperia oncophora]
MVTAGWNSVTEPVMGQCSVLSVAPDTDVKVQLHYYVKQMDSGHLSSRNASLDSRVHCDAGFRADGPEEVKCLANQSLSTVPSCRDVNECAEGLAQCQEASTKCVNLPGGYTCQCLSGFQPQLVCPSPSALIVSSLITSSESVPPTTLSTAGWCANKSDNLKSVTLHFTVPKVIEKIR